MSATDITFYAAVATVIPVFLVAYVVVVRETMGSLGEGYSKSSQRYLERLLYAVKNEDGKLSSILDAMWSLIRATAYQIASVTIFSVAVAMPAAAEYASLHALYAGNAASSSKTIGLVGALIAGGIVVGPLVVNVLKVYNPFNTFINLFRALVKELRAARSASDGDGCHGDTD
jgi:hypothetical protein